jgi:hypothetical protein
LAEGLAAMPTVGDRRTVLFAASIAADFTADGRCRPAELPGDLAERRTGNQSARYLLTFLWSQARRAALSRRRHYPTMSLQDAKYRRCMLAKSSANIAQRLTSLPPRPEVSLLFC